MIKQIGIQNVATYDIDGVEFNDLKKVNFIYGANGCGKTTISNFILDTSDPKFANCSLVWEHGLPLRTLVYNKEFRDRNFGKGKLSGIFTLGEATSEQIKEIEQKKEELQRIKDAGIQQREVLNQQQQKKDNIVSYDIDLLNKMGSSGKHK